MPAVFLPLSYEGMPREINAEKLLRKALSLVSNDMREIAVHSEQGKLDHGTASDLVAYARLLNEIQKNKTKKEDDAKKGLAKLSTEELLKRYEELKR